MKIYGKKNPRRIYLGAMAAILIVFASVSIFSDTVYQDANCVSVDASVCVTSCFVTSTYCQGVYLPQGLSCSGSTTCKQGIWNDGLGSPPGSFDVCLGNYPNVTCTGSISTAIFAYVKYGNTGVCNVCTLPNGQYYCEPDPCLCFGQEQPACTGHLC